MTPQEKIDKLVARQQQITKVVVKAKLKLKDDERKADVHVKLVLGAALLKVLKTLPVEIQDQILTEMDSKIQKSGLGREKFEALKHPALETTNTESEF